MHGRFEPRSRRAAIVRRSGARRDLRAVRHRPVADLRHADRGQLRPRRVLHGGRLCRAFTFCSLGGNFWICLIAGAAGGRPVRPRRGAGPDPSALRPRHRLSAAADVRPELRDGRTGPHRLRQERISVRHAGNACRAPSTSASAIFRSIACS